MEDAQVWWQVRHEGRVLRNYLADEETAEATAKELAVKGEGPFRIFRLEEREIRRYQRQITVTSVDTEA